METKNKKKKSIPILLISTKPVIQVLLKVNVSSPRHRERGAMAETKDGDAAERNKKQDYLSEVFFFVRSASAAAELLASLLVLIFFVGPCRLALTHTEEQNKKSLQAMLLHNTIMVAPPFNTPTL